MYVSKNDLAVACKDEYGVLYSRDFKRLLKAPKDIVDYSVNELTEIICSNAFQECKELKSVVIPQSVHLIGIGAFEDCQSLRQIKLPLDLENIFFRTFIGCYSLESIYIPHAVKHIDPCSFDFCINLSSIEVDIENPYYSSPEGSNVIIESKSNTLVLGCSNSNIPDGVSKIGASAFSGKTITSVFIPNSVTEIESEAFFGCMEMQSIIIPNSVKRIGVSSFSNCTNLKTVVFSSSHIQEIGNHAFDSCTSLQSMTLPKFVDKMGFQVFNNCPSLKQANIITNTIDMSKISDFFKAFQSNPTKNCKEDSESKQDVNNKEEMIQEALERMKSINLYSGAIAEFRDSRTPQVYEPPFGACYYLEEEDEENIKNVEQMYHVLVWGIIRYFFSYDSRDPHIDYFLTVSSNTKEWKQEREDLIQLTPKVYSFTKEHGIQDKKQINIYMSEGGTPLRKV